MLIDCTHQGLSMTMMPPSPSLLEVLVAVSVRVTPAGLHSGLPPHAVGYTPHLLHLPTTKVSQDSLVPHQTDHLAAVIWLEGDTTHLSTL